MCNLCEKWTTDGCGKTIIKDESLITIRLEPIPTLEVSTNVFKDIQSAHLEIQYCPLCGERLVSKDERISK